MDAPTPLASPTVAKIGGSLYDLADLGPRLTRWLTQVKDIPVLLVPGGGQMAEAVREMDRTHRLGEDRAHWLALQVMAVQARFLATLVPGAVVVEGLQACAEVWRYGRHAILDAHAFARADEGNEGALPHSWTVTSDSVAARAARLLKARKLVLLKSVDWPGEASWEEAARAGLVDAWFPRVAGELAVELLNFRRGFG
jgi:5-(aminomethyl)-3-furanmethanol phosphate kinase